MGKSLLEEKDTAIASLHAEIKEKETEVAETKLELKNLQEKTENFNTLEHDNETLRKEVDNFGDVRDALKDATKKLSQFRQLEEENAALRLKFQEFQDETTAKMAKRDEAIIRTIANLQKNVAAGGKTKKENVALTKELKRRESELLEANSALKDASRSILQLWEENARLQAIGA